ncbi:MAG: T9SS type A sorting domain-containing protein [Melioribacteraceae bacterium]
MKRTIVFLFLIYSLNFAQNAWINEFHYEDGATPDNGEFVEIAVENIFLYDKTKFRLCTYNGFNGKKSSNYFDLTEFVEGETFNNITLFSIFIIGIENGDPDGICLDYNKTIIQLISYEGTFIATDGVAEGITSTDIGVSESNSTPVGSSLGLTGEGTNYSSFTWTTFAVATPGQPNENQALPVELTTFSVSLVDKKVNLIWETATEVNNYGFNIERKTELGNWKKIAFVIGNGNSNSPKHYFYSDNLLFESGKYFYRLKQIDIDGNSEYSEEIEICFASPEKFELLQNYPNPFNPVTKIKFSIPENTGIEQKVVLKIYNVLGQVVKTLVNENKQPGNYEIEFSGSDLMSGIYFYKIESGNFIQMRKMVLTK